MLTLRSCILVPRAGKLQYGVPGDAVRIVALSAGVDKILSIRNMMFMVPDSSMNSRFCASVHNTWSKPSATARWVSGKAASVVAAAFGEPVPPSLPG